MVAFIQTNAFIQIVVLIKKCTKKSSENPTLWEYFPLGGIVEGRVEASRLNT